MPLIGDAGFEFTPSGGSPTTHALEVPARFETYGKERRRFIHQPIDFSVAPDRVVIGTAARAMTVEFRFDVDPTALVDMLTAAADDGITLTYYPSLADTGTSYDFLLINDGNPNLIEVQRDRQMPDNYFQRWEVRVRLRALDDMTDLITA